MSAATRATSATERARIAARFIRAGRPPGRPFDDCFEMNDGEQVIRHLRRMAATDARLRANWRHYFNTTTPTTSED